MFCPSILGLDTHVGSNVGSEIDRHDIRVLVACAQVDAAGRRGKDSALLVLIPPAGSDSAVTGSALDAGYVEFELFTRNGGGRLDQHDCDIRRGEEGV